MKEPALREIVKIKAALTHILHEGFGIQSVSL